MKIVIFLVIGVLTMASNCVAKEADVVDVAITTNDKNSFTVAVTVQHNDDGWKHYCNRWDILTMDGKWLDTRVLFHPHSPAPFTRSLISNKIPANIGEIRIRAHDSVHGYGGKEVTVQVPR